MSRPSCLIGLCVLGLVLGSATPARANSPDPRAACADAEEGDRCSLQPYYEGECYPAETCTYDPYGNGCLMCPEDSGVGCSTTASPVNLVFWLQALALVIGLGMLRYARRRRPDDGR